MNTPEEIARLIQVMEPTCAICHKAILTPKEFTFFSRVKDGRVVQERFFHATCSAVVFKTHLAAEER